MYRCDGCGVRTNDIDRLRDHIERCGPDAGIALLPSTPEEPVTKKELHWKKKFEALKTQFDAECQRRADLERRFDHRIQGTAVIDAARNLVWEKPDDTPQVRELRHALMNVLLVADGRASVGFPST